MQKKIKVLVVDDSSFMRNMIVRMIEKDPQERFEVVGVAINGQDGVEKTRQLRPDVITLDIEMPVMTGIEALDIIMKEQPTPIVMVSTLTESGAAITVEALNKGAVDFLPKALKDKDKNIFSAAETIYEKLMAAATSNVGEKAQARAKALGATTSVAGKIPKSTLTSFDARVLVIGSSTGGPRALQTVLGKLPATLRVPVVIAQHMPAEFTGALAARLDEQCPLKVQEVKAGDQLRPGNVYIASGGNHTRIELGFTSNVSPDAGESVFKPSVDVLGESALKVAADKVMAVMLTGMGADGARAFKAIKEKGGHVIAQDAESCVVYGMPKAVVESDGASEVLPLDQIAARVAGLLS